MTESRKGRAPRQGVPEGYCEDCAKRPGISYSVEQFERLLCGQCIQDRAIWDASLAHLKGMLTDVYNDWLDAWAESETYRRDWESLFGTMTTDIELEHFALALLSERRIVPKYGA